MVSILFSDLDMGLALFSTSPRHCGTVKLVKEAYPSCCKSIFQIFQLKPQRLN